MCLTINPFTWCRTAKEDIVVYKVIKKYTSYGYSGWYSPYYSEKGIVFDTILTSALIRETLCSVEEGYHSFKTKSAAKNERGYHQMRHVANQREYGIRNDNDQYHVVQCIIPKGAKYYKGRFGGEVSYASDKLIFTQKD